MATCCAIESLVEYKVVLIHSASRSVLGIDVADQIRLPRVTIPSGLRRTQQLRKQIYTAWGLRVFVVDFIGDDVSVNCVVAEASNADESSAFTTVSLSRVPDDELSEKDRGAIESLLDSNSAYEVSRLGWINDATAWVKTVTQRKVLTDDIEQLNAGGGFALARFRTDDRQTFWLKTAAAPHAHELPITSFLAEIAGDYLPTFLASKPEWNAWLMSGEGTVLAQASADPLKVFDLLQNAVTSMAELQIKTVGRMGVLRRLGAFDQGVAIVAAHSQELFDCLGEAMHLQTSNKASPLGTARLREIQGIFDEVCARMSALNLPETVIHGDLSFDNIVSQERECVFIDWAEAYIGNPLVTLQHLLLLNQVESPGLRISLNETLTDRYRTVIERVCERDVIDQALIYMPLIAAASALYGRGDWMANSSNHVARSHVYMRSLARSMDRAARNPQLLNAVTARSRSSRSVSISAAEVVGSAHAGRGIT